MATTLAKGDMAIIQYSSDSGPLTLTGDGFTFVLLIDVDATTSINFTDAGYNTAGVIINDTIVHEGTITWTSGAALSAGTTVRIFDNVTGDASHAFQTATVGSITGTVGAINGFATSGDQVTAYQGAVAATGQTPNLLFGASFADDAAANPLLANGWNTNAPAFNGVAFDNSESQLPASLIGFEVGFNPEVDNAYYNGTQTGTPASVLAAILNEANWVASNDFQGIGVNGLDLPVAYNFFVSAPSNSPTLDTNTGSTLNEGATDIVTAAELETNDTDTADSSLVYTLDTTTSNGSLYIDNDGSNTLTGGDTVLGVASTFTQQNIANGDLQYQHNDGETTSDSFQFDVSDGPNSINNQTFNFTINAVNDIPVITGFAGDSSAYNEAFGGPVLIEIGQDVVVSDVDDADYNGGSLTVSITGALAEDQLSFNSSGGTGIGIASPGVFFNSVQIGVFSGGTNGANLVVTFTTPAANDTAVAALIEALRYDNSDNDNPTAGVRSINVILNDGDGNSAASTASLTVTAVDTPAVAIDDAFTTGETTAIAGQSVFTANPTTPDSDADTGLTVTQVNGNGGSVGTQVTLGSGALLQLNANGTFNYDPNGSFTSVASGATATDTFTYQLNGDDTATVTVTLTGIDNDDTLIATAVVEAHDGGVGNNTVSFENAASTGVTANLGANTSTGDVGAGDTFANIQNFLGSSFADVLTGDAGANILDGGLGDDTLDGGAGIDTASFASFSGPVNVNLNLSGAQATGAGNDTLANIENLTGGIGADRLIGAAGANGDNVLSGGDGNDNLYGIGGNDTLNGGDGNDSALAGAGADTLNGNAGDDILKGGNDNDTLTGGVGRDQLYGEAGADTFTFNDVSETGLVYADRDIIRDFSQADGDLIDLSGIDAVTGGGDDAFSFLGTFPSTIPSIPFTNVAGQLFAVNTAGGQTVVWGDVDGDGTQDFTFVLDGALALTDSDFIL